MAEVWVDGICLPCGANRPDTRCSTTAEQKRLGIGTLRRKLVRYYLLLVCMCYRFRGAKFRKFIMIRLVSSCGLRVLSRFLLVILWILLIVLGRLVIRLSVGVVILLLLLLVLRSMRGRI